MIERTFIAVKPDAVQRGLIGRIITRIEEKGYKIIALKMLEVTPTGGGTLCRTQRKAVLRRP